LYSGPHKNVTNFADPLHNIFSIYVPIVERLQG